MRTAIAGLGGRVWAAGHRRGVVVMALILGLAAFLRFYQLSDHYFHALDTTVQIAGLEALMKHGAYPYTSYGPPGNGFSVLPFLILGDYSFWAAQIGVALYGVATVIAVFALTRRLAPEMRVAPYLAAFLVAINPMLVTTSRVLYFDTAQILFLTVYLLMVLATERGTRRPWLVASSFLIGFALVLMRLPYVMVVGVGTVYMASGLVATLGGPKWEARRAVGLGTGVVGFAASFLLYVAAAPTEAGKMMTAGEGQFVLQGDVLEKNAKVLMTAWANPVSTPATSVISNFSDPSVSTLGVLVGLLIVTLAALGLAAVLARRRWDGLLVVAATLVPVLFYLPYVNWRINYALPGLVVLLALAAVGVEHSINKRWEMPRRSRMAYSLAISVYLLAVAASAVGAVDSDSRMLREWNSPDSMIQNNILMFPEDRERVTAILEEYPDAYVVSTMASFVSIADGARERETLDLFVFGRERKNSLDSVDELKGIVDSQLAQGRQVLYLPWWYEIEAAQEGLENRFKIYLDFFLRNYDVDLLYKGVNVYRNKERRPDRVPTTLVYRVLSPLDLPEIARQPVNLGQRLWDVPSGYVYAEDDDRSR